MTRPCDTGTSPRTTPHDGLDVSNARIREAHSLMAAEWLKGDEEVHQAYKQGHDERCYICALLARQLRLAQALRLLRDTGSEYTRNVAGRALEEAGIPDPPEEDHP